MPCGIVFEVVCFDFGVVCGGLRYFNGPLKLVKNIRVYGHKSMIAGIFLGLARAVL